MYQTGP